MKLPKLYRPVTIRFWSLRNGIGHSGGVIYDIDTEVERKVRRVRNLKWDCGWSWQMIDYDDLAEYDYCVVTDQEVLDSYEPNELEFTIVE